MCESGQLRIAKKLQPFRISIFRPLAPAGTPAVGRLLGRDLGAFHLLPTMTPPPETNSNSQFFENDSPQSPREQIIGNWLAGVCVCQYFRFW